MTKFLFLITRYITRESYIFYALILIIFYILFIWFSRESRININVVDLTSNVYISALHRIIVLLLFSSISLGFIVMSLIQLYKPKLRILFHKLELERWLTNKYNLKENDYISIEDDSINVTSKNSVEDVELQEIYPNFISWISLGNSYAFLGLPIEQLTAQIQTAVETELAVENSYKEIVGAKSLSPQPNIIYSKSNPKQLINIIAGKIFFNSDGDYNELNSEKSTIVNEISYKVQRRLDSLQIEVKYNWKNTLFFLSFSLSLLLSILLSALFGLWNTEHNIITALIIIVLSLLSSFFSSVARDCVAIIERLRS